MQIFYLYIFVRCMFLNLVFFYIFIDVDKKMFRNKNTFKSILHYLFMYIELNIICFFFLLFFLLIKMNNFLVYLNKIIFIEIFASCYLIFKPKLVDLFIYPLYNILLIDLFFFYKQKYWLSCLNISLDKLIYIFYKY